MSRICTRFELLQINVVLALGFLARVFQQAIDVDACFLLGGLIIIRHNSDYGGVPLSRRFIPD